MDPDTALLAVDLQKRIVGAPFVHPIGEVITRALMLIVAFRARRFPIVLVNVAVAYALIAKVGTFHARALPDAAATGLGMAVIGLFSARHFGRFHGGNEPQRQV